MGARLRRLLRRRLHGTSGGRPERFQPPVRRDRARPRRRPPRLAADPLDLWDLGVARRRRDMEPADGRTPCLVGRDRYPPGPAEPDHAVRVLLERQDLQEHQRRRDLESDHERASDGRELRRRPHEVQPGAIAPRRTWSRALYGLRLGRHRQPPPGRTPLQVDRSRRDLGRNRPRHRHR